MKISNKLKALVMAATMAVSGLVAVAPTYAVTCPAGTIKAGQDATTLANCNVQDDEQGGDLLSRVKTIINIIIAAVGFIAVVMIIIGGISYTISAGDAGKVKKAKDTILYGVIGLVIALLAFAIVNFVLSSVFTTTPA